MQIELATAEAVEKRLASTDDRAFLTVVVATNAAGGFVVDVVTCRFAFCATVVVVVSVIVLITTLVPV